MEIVKQRRQASFKNLSTVQILVAAVRQEGIFGLYRGFGSTIIRDVPFALVEFPIWEWSKKEWSSRIKRELNAAEVAVCGAIAGTNKNLYLLLCNSCTTRPLGKFSYCHKKVYPEINLLIKF